MARRELYDADDLAAEPASLAQLAELRRDINQALQQISSQLAARPNPSPRSSAGESSMQSQLFALQAEMREQARSENERLRAEIRELQVKEDPIDEIERAQRLVEILPQEKDETKEMIMGALGMLAEVMTRDTPTDEEPTTPAAPGNAGYVSSEHHGSAESFDPSEHSGAGSEVPTNFGVVLVEN